MTYSWDTHEHWDIESGGQTIKTDTAGGYILVHRWELVNWQHIAMTLETIW